MHIYSLSFAYNVNIFIVYIERLTAGNKRGNIY